MHVCYDSVVESILDFFTLTSEERNVVLVVLECSVLKQFACFCFSSAKHWYNAFERLAHENHKPFISRSCARNSRTRERCMCVLFSSLLGITRELSYVVDLVADNGHYWIKVTARNASALHRTWGRSIFNPTPPYGWVFWEIFHVTSRNLHYFPPRPVGNSTCLLPDL